MFKRIQKRQIKRQREEELGIDEDMKEVLGLQDTDSEESNSSSEGEDRESNSDDAEDEEGLTVDIPVDLEEDEEMDEDMESDDEETNELPEMSVTEAVKNPVYIVSLEPRTEACILCPGKLLKNQTMSEVHKASKAHNRRFTRFVELVGKAGPEANVKDLLRAMKKENTAPSQRTDASPSKRALKRKEKLAAVKTKRLKKKKAAEMARKRREKRERASAAAGKASDNPEQSDKLPPRKKRRIASGEETTKATSPAKVDSDESQSNHAAGGQSSSATKPQTSEKSLKKVMHIETKPPAKDSGSKTAAAVRTKKTRKAPKPTS